MSENIIFKECQLTITEQVSDQNNDLLREITNLGFKIEKFDPLYITGNNISYSAITKLCNVLNTHHVSKLEKSFIDINNSQEDQPQSRKWSPLEQNDCQSNRDEPFEIVSYKDTYNPVLPCQLSELSMTSRDDGNGASLSRTKPEHVNFPLPNHTETHQPLYISRAASQDFNSKMPSTGTKQENFIENPPFQVRDNEMRENDRNNIPLISEIDKDTYPVSECSEKESFSYLEIRSGLKEVKLQKAEENDGIGQVACAEREASVIPMEVDDPSSIVEKSKILEVEESLGNISGLLAKQRLESGEGKAITTSFEISKKNKASRDSTNMDTKDSASTEMSIVEKEAYQKKLPPREKRDENEKKYMCGDPHVTDLKKQFVKREIKEITDVKTKEVGKDTVLTDPYEETMQHMREDMQIKKSEMPKSQANVKYRENDCREKTSACSSKLLESNQSLPKMEKKDSMPSSSESSHSEDDWVVISFKKNKFQAAKKYFKCCDLSKHSVEKVNDFEITLNKKTDLVLISQVKDFKLEEIIISIYEKALSAKEMLSGKFQKVKFEIDGNKALIYGLLEDVISAKKAFIKELGNQDDINMWKNDDSAACGSRISAQEDESKVKQNKIYASRGQIISSEDDKLNNSAGCRKKGTSKTREPAVPHCARSENVQECNREKSFYVGSRTNLNVSVRKANITNFPADIIVNAANKHLHHGGGVAKAIASAAGYLLKNECNLHINAHGPLKVTDVFVSTGGLLEVKHVMHAVGPKWESYPDKERCLTDLRRTVVRCLVEASRLRKLSIALPSISAAIFKVPKELCADCYMDAVKYFDDFADKLDIVPVKDIWFVDVNDDMVNIIQEKFINDWYKPVDGRIAKEDFKFAQQHLSKKKDDKSGSSTGSSAFQYKNQQTSHHGKKSGEENHKMVSQGTVANTVGYQVNSIEIHIVTKPATVCRAVVVVVGKLFDELSGLKNFNAKDSAKVRFDLPKQKGAFQFLSLSKPDGSQSILICQLHPNPDNPDNVNKAFENLENVEEIHRSEKVVFTSAVFYAKPKKLQDNTKIISRIAQKVFDFAAVTSSIHSAIKYILFATSADCTPHIIKIFDSRELEKIQPRQILRGPESFQHLGQYGPTAVNQQGAYPGSSGRYPATSGGYPASDLSTPVDSQYCCSVCFENRHIQLLNCCRALLCTTCLGKVSVCPLCRCHFKILIGKQPTGEMRWSYSSQDVEGYERKGSLEIQYNIPAGVQTEELQHPSPGKPYRALHRLAYLPATDDGYKALRLLRVAFLRRLTFTMDLSHTMQTEGIVWNIHHKTSRESSTHGYPDPQYLMRLMIELKENGVTEDSMTEGEKRLSEEFMTSVRKT